MRDAIPVTPSEVWDEIAGKVEDARGEWVIVAQSVARPRNEKVRQYLENRGLVVEVTSRIGDGSSERPWTGWRTWARSLTN